MSFVFFEDVLLELNHRLTYDAIANYAGNSFIEKSWEMIIEHHPMLITQGGVNKTGRQSSGLQQLANFFGGTATRKNVTHSQRSRL